METIKNELNRNWLADLVGNPLLSERDGNLKVPSGSKMSLTSGSETHYSLKEMETSSLF